MFKGTSDGANTLGVFGVGIGLEGGVEEICEEFEVDVAHFVDFGKDVMVHVDASGKFVIKGTKVVGLDRVKRE